MNILRRILGIVWILLGPASVYFTVSNALEASAKADTKIAAAATDAAKAVAEAAKTNTILQWSIFVIVFLPIAAGLIIFGMYALKGEYDSSPQMQKGVA